MVKLREKEKGDLYISMQESISRRIKGNYTLGEIALSMMKYYDTLKTSEEQKIFFVSLIGYVSRDTKSKVAKELREKSTGLMQQMIKRMGLQHN